MSCLCCENSNSDHWALTVTSCAVCWTIKHWSLNNTVGVMFIKLWLLLLLLLSTIIFLEKYCKFSGKLLPEIYRKNMKFFGEILPPHITTSMYAFQGYSLVSVSRRCRDAISSISVSSQTWNQKSRSRTSMSHLQVVQLIFLKLLSLTHNCAQCRACLSDLFNLLYFSRTIVTSVNCIDVLIMKFDLLLHLYQTRKLYVITM